MKYFFLFATLIYSFTLSAQEYDRLNIDLLGRWSVPTEKEEEFGTRYSSCWAFEYNGREYAIVGCGNGTAYIDITDPKNPVFIDFVPSNIKDAIWREYKTYKHYAYHVSDDGGPNTFDIVDFSYLPDSVHVVYSGSKEYFRTGHTIFMATKCTSGYTITVPCRYSAWKIRSTLNFYDFCPVIIPEMFTICL